MPECALRCASDPQNEMRNTEMLSAACAVGVGCCFAAPIGGKTARQQMEQQMRTKHGQRAGQRGVKLIPSAIELRKSGRGRSSFLAAASRGSGRCSTAISGAAWGGAAP